MIKGIWQSFLVVSTPSAHLVEDWEITKDMTMSAKTIWYSLEFGKLALPFFQVKIVWKIHIFYTINASAESNFLLKFSKLLCT